MTDRRIARYVGHSIFQGLIGYAALMLLVEASWYASVGWRLFRERRQ